MEVRCETIRRRVASFVQERVDDLEAERASLSSSLENAHRRLEIADALNDCSDVVRDFDDLLCEVADLREESSPVYLHEEVRY